MSKIKLIQFKLKSESSKDVLWSFFSTLIRMGGGLIILPIILIKFSPKELGLWYFFSTVGMFILMIDAGFCATLERNFRYVISNSKVYKYGVNNSISNHTAISLEEFMYVAKKIYFYLSMFSLIILTALTFYIIKILIESRLDLAKNLIAWFIYSISLCLNLRYYYRGAVLSGLNKIHLAQKIEVISSTINYFSTGIFVFLNFGLISLAAGTLIGLVIRIVLYEYYVKIIIVKTNKEKLIEILKILWPNTWRTGISNLLGYLIKYLNSYFITIFLGLQIMGSFGLTFQIITLIISISSIWINTAYPMLSTLRIEREYVKFYKLFYSRLEKGLISYVVLSLCFLFLGNWILTFLHTKTEILSTPFSLFIVSYMLIDFITNSYGYIIMTGNKIPFIKSSLITVTLIIIFNLIFNYFNFGLWGVLISTFLAGSLYNYWHWIYVGYNELENLIKNDCE